MKLELTENQLLSILIRKGNLDFVQRVVSDCYQLRQANERFKQGASNDDTYEGG